MHLMNYDSIAMEGKGRERGIGRGAGGGGMISRRIRREIACDAKSWVHESVNIPA